MSYVVAVYEMDRAYGGPEEGGWWYDAGELVRVLRVARSEERAYALAARINRTLRHRRDGDPSHRDISSVLYAGGHLEAQVCERTAPESFPAQRPVYE